MVSEPAWVEPCPDAWLAASNASPEARYDTYESISLAFLVALRILPPRQRTVLILADVLDWKMSEIADLVEISLSATTSLLHRARETLKQRNQSGRLHRSRMSIPKDQTRVLLDQYARAWESADLDGIIALLAGDAILPIFGRKCATSFETGQLTLVDRGGSPKDNQGNNLSKWEKDGRKPTSDQLCCLSNCRNPV